MLGLAQKLQAHRGATAGGIVQATAESGFAFAPCVSCGYPVGPGELIYVCSACRGSYHLGCWAATGACVGEECAKKEKGPSPISIDAAEGSGRWDQQRPRVPQAVISQMKAPPRTGPLLVALGAIVVCVALFLLIPAFSGPGKSQAPTTAIPVLPPSSSAPPPVEPATAPANIPLDLSNVPVVVPPPAPPETAPAQPAPEPTPKATAKRHWSGLSYAEVEDLRRLIRGMSAGDLRFVRNQIFAQHGRIFDDPELSDYFASQDWYHPDPDYSDSRLSAHDRAKIRFLLAEENKRR